MCSDEGTKEIHDISFYYKIIGKGKPIMMLHGGPGLEHTYLLPQMARLAKEYQLIFYDQRGTGRSSGDVDATSITLENFLSDLEGLRTQFKLDAMNLMGHSWGGLLALFYAIRYPENINSLMLINSAAACSDFWKPFEAHIERNRTQEDRRMLNDLVESRGFKRRTVESVREFLTIHFRAYFFNQLHGRHLNLHITEKTAQNMDMVNALLFEHIRVYDIHEELSGFKSPTLIVHGDSDPLPSTYSKKIHERIEHSQYFLLKDCGHFPYIESQEQFFSIVRDFLRDYA